MSAQKQPKPFLKRGTRKFLSNATVRSLNQKPNLVQFDDPNEVDLQQTKSIQSVTFARKQEEEIIVQVKKTPNNKSNSSHNMVAQNRKPKENKPMNHEQFSSNTNSKKKQTLLQDYMGGQSSSNKKELGRSSFSKQKSKPVVSNGTHFNSMVGSLQRQEIQTNSDEESIHQTPIPTKTVQQNPASNKNMLPPKVNVTKKSLVIDEQQQSQQRQKIVFKQQSDEEQEKISIKKPVNQKFNQMNVPNNKPKTKYESKNKWDQEQQHQQQNNYQEETSKGPSKVLQKYYKKEPIKTEEKIEKTAPISKMSMSDISNELKEKVISEYLSDKKSEIEKKLDELKEQYNKIKKQKERYEQDNKKLVKQKQQFYKQMQEKTKEFEQKLKAENNKLNRQKRYMKDVQVSGKADWRLKNEVQELKAKVQQSQNEKKKMKGDYMRQNDRLKKKVQQIIQQNQSLKQQIKYIEMQKLQAKQKTKKIQKTLETTKKLSFWQGAPTNSYLYSFGEPDFSLFNFEPNFFTYDNLEHYKYYLLKRSEEVELQRQEQGANNNIVRKYKNGKEQIEYVSKVLKQNFPAPFKFSVVTHQNGSIKLIYPNGIIVFYDQRNQITEFQISTQKTIHHFHRLGQIEMKFRHKLQGDIHELRKGNMLIRKSRKGEQKFKRLQSGVIQRID